jgi:hypothetical protein
MCSKGARYIERPIPIMLTPGLGICFRHTERHGPYLVVWMMHPGRYATSHVSCMLGEPRHMGVEEKRMNNPAAHHF